MTKYILLTGVLSLSAGLILLAVDSWNLGVVMIVVGVGLWMVPNAWMRSKS
jgi:hypothetical protein